MHSRSTCCQRLEFCPSVAHSCCLLLSPHQIKRQCPTIVRHYSEVKGGVSTVSASADVGVVSEQCRSLPTSDADFGVVSALVDVGRRRWRCVGIMSASANVGVMSVQYHNWADVDGQNFCYPSVRSRRTKKLLEEVWTAPFVLNQLSGVREFVRRSIRCEC